MKGIVDWSWASGRLRGMGTFKRANEAESAGQAGERADLNVLLLRGEDVIEPLARAHMSWGLGKPQCPLASVPGLSSHADTARRPRASDQAGGGEPYSG